MSNSWRNVWASSGLPASFSESEKTSSVRYTARNGSAFREVFQLFLYYHDPPQNTWVGTLCQFQNRLSKCTSTYSVWVEYLTSLCWKHTIGVCFFTIVTIFLFFLSNFDNLTNDFCEVGGCYYFTCTLLICVHFCVASQFVTALQFLSSFCKLLQSCVMASKELIGQMDFLKLLLPNLVAALMLETTLLGGTLMLWLNRLHTVPWKSNDTSLTFLHFLL